VAGIVYRTSSVTGGKVKPWRRKKSGEKIQRQTGTEQRPDYTKRMKEHTKVKAIIFSLKSNTITTDPRRSPSSLPYLIIRLKIGFLAHLYSTKSKMKLGSDKEPHPF
jgi:hypothetical protein